MKNLRSGFTLIELSIVLVIIGLIVGGILVGQELIEGAKTRATIAQFEKFDTAVNTFRLKYRYIPGDIPAVQAGQLGFFQLANGYGNGNGLVDSTTNCNLESLAFWRHLSDANLIDGSYGTTGNSALIPATGHITANTTDIRLSLPPAKMGRGAYYIAASGTVQTLTTNWMATFYTLDKIVSISSGIGGSCSSGSAVNGWALTPIETQTLDTKIDDGRPIEGTVMGGGLWAAAGTAGRCTMGGASWFDPLADYNVSTATGGDVPACALTKIWNK